ncbi:MAG: hypothetical protein LBP75_11720 [Planctomycetota bacterium]|jgi:hypothetical protein|nr:hypothetical protein [Planctomycetota bacterium]
MYNYILYDLSSEDYFAAPAVNRSALWKILDTPASYKWAVDNPPETTEAMVN